MKKGVLIGAFVLILILPLVSAQFYLDFKSAAEQLIQFVQDVFGPFFEVLLGVSSIDEYFFSRILLLILLYVIILTVLKRMSLFMNYPFVYILVSAIVAVLATRYMSEFEVVSFVLLPYGALGISLAVFLPFLIYGFFVHESVPGTIGRRAAWVVFALVFFGFWLTRYSDLEQYNWIYWMGIGAVAISIAFDGTVHRYFEFGKYRRIEKGFDVDQYAKNEERIQRIENLYPRGEAVMPGGVRTHYRDLLNIRKHLRKKASS